MSEQMDIDTSQLQSQGDTTQPAEDIISVLRQLNPPPAAATASASSNGLVKSEEDVAVSASAVPQSEWEALKSRLDKSPHDPEGWNKLVRLAEESGDLEKIKATYEALLAMYPNTVRGECAWQVTAASFDLELVRRANRLPQPFLAAWPCELC